MTTHLTTGHLRPMTFLSLFAGVGGFDLALVRLGMRCVGQVELDPTARGVLARHFPETPRHDDIHTTIAWWHATPRRPQVDLICAGWPCQDLSQAGRRAGTRSELFFELARVVDALRPGWLLLENVPGLLNANRGADFQTVLDTLVQLGYGVSWRVLDARYFLRTSARLARARSDQLDRELSQLVAQRRQQPALDPFGTDGQPRALAGHTPPAWGVAVGVGDRREHSQRITLDEYVLPAAHDVGQDELVGEVAGVVAPAAVQVERGWWRQPVDGLIVGEAVAAQLVDAFAVWGGQVFPAGLMDVHQDPS